MPQVKDVNNLITILNQGINDKSLENGELAGRRVSIDEKGNLCLLKPGEKPSKKSKVLTFSEIVLLVKKGYEEGSVHDVAACKKVIAYLDGRKAKRLSNALCPAAHNLFSKVQNYMAIGTFKTSRELAAGLVAALDADPIATSALKNGLLQLQTTASSSFEPFHINGHTYGALGPRTALNMKEAPSVNEFVTKIAAYPVVVNLMGPWQINQMPEHYTSNQLHSSERSTFYNCCRMQLAGLMKIVQPDHTLKLALTEQELAKAQTSAETIELSDAQQSQIKELINQANKYGLEIKGRTPNELLKNGLHMLNSMLSLLNKEDANEVEFAKNFVEGPSLGDIAVYRNDSTHKGNLYEVPWMEGVANEKMAEELKEKLRLAKAIASTVGDRDQVFVHCHKGYARTGIFLLMLELFRNKEQLKNRSDLEVYQFMDATIRQIAQSESNRVPTSRVIDILFTHDFVQEFRKLAN